MNIDYDIHGWLGLRLVDPQPAFAKFVSREFHPLTPSTLRSEPDIALVATSDRPLAKSTYRLGNAGDYQECIYGDSDFCLVSGGKTLCIPFASVGASCEIRYTAGFSPRRAFSYVRSVLQLSLLTKGAVAIHSAAMTYKGKGILFAGWAESGKTEAMLGFLDRGASFVSDKWTILKEDGSGICNFPTPITLRAWMLKYLPELGKNLTTAEKWRLRIGALAGSAASSTRIDPAVALVDLLRPALELGSRVSVSPNRLFRLRNASEPSGLPSPTAPLDKLFFLISSNAGGVSVRPTKSAEIIGRLADCAQYERRRLLGLYTKFKYAFPDKRNTLIDEAQKREADMLNKALKSKEIFLVEAPFPFDPKALGEALEPFC